MPQKSQSESREIDPGENSLQRSVPESPVNPEERLLWMSSFDVRRVYTVQSDLHILHDFLYPMSKGILRHIYSHKEAVEMIFPK